MDYLALTKSLRQEALAGIQYKRMKAPFNVLAFITMLPYIIAAFLSFVWFYVFVFVYNGISAAADYLESWVDRKKKDIHPATEAVLFFITIPFIFVCHCFLSIFSIIFYFAWFLIQIICYLATLGGTRWQPFLYHAKFGDEAPKFCARTKIGVAHTFTIINLSLVGLGALLFLISLVVDSARTAATIGDIRGVFMVINILFVCIAIPFMFKKKFGTEEELKEFEASYYANRYAAPAYANYYGAQPVATPVAQQPVSAPQSTGSQDDDFLPEL